MKAFADFAAPETAAPERTEEEPASADMTRHEQEGGGEIAGINLGYTINLHLPATSDIAVFNAVFKSIREHLLR
ncbi:MAG: hypothetical protein MSC30_18535 [Gaiellaceae bacterium MAG52_C11]|nr:hypothetical protein [Candidatus Gaiellasilicea maunaloa]